MPPKRHSRPARGNPLSSTPAGPSSQSSLPTSTPFPLATQRTRRTRQSVAADAHIASSSPAVRATRSGRRGARDELDEEDIVPPSDDDEYEEWRNRRAAEKSIAEAGAASSPTPHVNQNRQLAQARSLPARIQPKKPDKGSPQAVRTTPLRPKAYVNLFSPDRPPSPSESGASSPTSGETSPTLRLNFAHEDPAFPVSIENRGESAAFTRDLVKRLSPNPSPLATVEAGDGSDDELDFLPKRPRRPPAEQGSPSSSSRFEKPTPSSRSRPVLPSRHAAENQSLSGVIASLDLERSHLRDDLSHPPLEGAHPHVTGPMDDDDEMAIDDRPFISITPETMALMRDEEGDTMFPYRNATPTPWQEDSEMEQSRPIPPAAALDHAGFPRSPTPVAVVHCLSAPVRRSNTPKFDSLGVLRNGDGETMIPPPFQAIMSPELAPDDVQTLGSERRQHMTPGKSPFHRFSKSPSLATLAGGVKPDMFPPKESVRLRELDGDESMDVEVSHPVPLRKPHLDVGGDEMSPQVPLVHDSPFRETPEDHPQPVHRPTTPSLIQEDESQLTPIIPSPKSQRPFTEYPAHVLDYDAPVQDQEDDWPSPSPAEPIQERQAVPSYRIHTPDLSQFQSQAQPSLVPGPRGSSPEVDLAAMFEEIAARPVPARLPSPTPAPASIPAPAPVASPVDAALQQFRTGRTFRTRTNVQLHPYTKERQLYEAMIRKGGIRAKQDLQRAHAEKRRKEEKASREDEDDAMVSQGSEASVSESDEAEEAVDDGTGERIVIGPGASPSRPIRPSRPQVPIEDGDIDEYLMTFGVVPDIEDMDETTSRKLQKIARQRIRKAKDDEKKRRQEERRQRRFQRALKELSHKEEQEKRELERLKEQEIRQKKQKVREERFRRLQEAHEAKRTVAEQRRKERQNKKRREEEIDNDTVRFLNGLRRDDDVESGDGDVVNSQEARQDEEFELFMKGLRGSSETEEAHEVMANTKRAQAPKSRTNKRTPGGVKTYGHRERRPNRIPSSSESEIVTLKAKPSHSSHPARSHSPHRGPFPSLSYRTRDADINHGDVDAQGSSIDYGPDYPAFPPSYSPHFASAAPSQLPHVPSPGRQSPIGDPSFSDDVNNGTSEDDESGDFSSEEAPHDDPRRKIARRMMPARMLRKLEQEAALKEKEKQERKRRELREREAGIAPVGPGRAVVRRQEGQGAFDEITELFSQENESEGGGEASDGRAGGSGNERRPISVYDSDSSQAYEDNVAEQSLARLHQGDFEGIVAGRGRRFAAGERARRRNTDGRRDKPAKRPPLGLIRKKGGSIAGREDNRSKEPRQTRLDFSVVGDEESRSRKKRKRHHGDSALNQRPAIRLDDNVIFAADDFAFESGDDDPAPRSLHPARTSRTYERVTSTSSNVSNAATELDAGIGKARSWANFDRFSTDFDISPLPAGLYCDSDSIPGSGRLASLVTFLRRQGNQTGVMPGIVKEFDIELAGNMPPAAVQEVIDIIFDATHRHLLALANNSFTAPVPLGPLIFLSSYVSGHGQNGDLASLKKGLLRCVEEMLVKLDGVDIGQSSGNQLAKDSLLNIEWALFELTCRTCAGAAEEATSAVLVKECTFVMLRQLLLGGFDLTIRPLKAIMAGESVSPEISETPITLWISILHSTSAWDSCAQADEGTLFHEAFDRVIDTVFQLDRTGPIAAERIWYFVFGLCALSQFNEKGEINETFNAVPRWTLVKRAVSLIKVVFDEDAEKRAHPHTLRGRDRYIKAMMARCIKLSAVWKWYFERASFSLVNRDLGNIFKDRQYRNLPTEPPVDYPEFITHYDMSLSASENTRHETAFDLYLRLVCVAASDIIAGAESLEEAQRAEKDVQRLAMSTIPISSVKFNRILPPGPRDLAQLTNRYSTMIAACYFSPSLLEYLLTNSKNWSPFAQADYVSREVCIRGLMYLAVACRHHDQPLDHVVERLAEILKILQDELEGHAKGTLPPQAAKMPEIKNTMVLIVACFKEMIKHHSFDVEEQSKAVYPDPSLLHESWTLRIFDLDLANDLKCGFEVISTVQAFLDARAKVLPDSVRRRRAAKESVQQQDSYDEYGSMGIDFSAADVLALGGEEAAPDPTEESDKQFVEIIENVISPKIYQLLSDMLPFTVDEEDLRRTRMEDRHLFIGKLTKCWSDCAAVLVVEHMKLDWNTFISSHGRQSWTRLGDERGRVQVGLHFMLNVLELDPSSFTEHGDDFVALLFQSIGTDNLTIEHKYAGTLLNLTQASEHPLLVDVCAGNTLDMNPDRTDFMDAREQILQTLFTTCSNLLASGRTPASTKAFIYRCINTFVSSLASYDKSIKDNKVLHKESYRAFLDTTVSNLQRYAGTYFHPMSVPGLKYFTKS
ncbi:hypothetical protein IAR50_002948 [Cryptococcus sp. DSM 104548]